MLMGGCTFDDGPGPCDYHQDLYDDFDWVHVSAQEPHYLPPEMPQVQYFKHYFITLNLEYKVLIVDTVHCKESLAAVNNVPDTLKKLWCETVELSAGVLTVADTLDRLSLFCLLYVCKINLQDGLSSSYGRICYPLKSIGKQSSKPSFSGQMWFRVLRSYMIVISSDHDPGEKTRLQLPTMKENDTHCIDFSYLLYSKNGVNPGALNILVRVNKGPLANPIWNVTGSTGKDWLRAELAVSTFWPNEYQVKFITISFTSSEERD
ncbi:hypothetical protein AAES_165017 [Amazona aestiva]|uniref:MAM domain-containing protein n=1 Tax=Amazona aestiva TaxID=12930 RepID=A0A0Q3NZP9_AMAAE|nr:hypothetical protein AAES_165017 [Amazona aestiva]